MGLKAAIRRFREVQNEFSKNGAGDTEPDAAFCMYVQDVFEKGPHDEELLEPPGNWCLLGKNRGPANRELDRAARNVGRHVLRLAKLLLWLQSEVWRGGFTMPRPVEPKLDLPQTLEPVRTWRLLAAVADVSAANFHSAVSSHVTSGMGSENKTFSSVYVEATRTRIRAIHRAICNTLGLEKPVIIVEEQFDEEN